mgnify:CR=1 FL=1
MNLILVSSTPKNKMVFQDKEIVALMILMRHNESLSDRPVPPSSLNQTQTTNIKIGRSVRARLIMGQF